MNLLKKILPIEENNRKLFSVGITVVLSGILTLWGIYGIKQYGIALFILTPLFMGALAPILYGYGRKISSREAWHISVLTLAVFSFVLIIFAIEGLLCIIMASPIVLFINWIGSQIGFLIINKSPNHTPISIVILFGVIPLMAFVEKEMTPTLTAVVTSIEIDAPPQIVWKHVIEFPPLEKPTEFIFKTGIAYPINATIIGTGVGAVRHCNFTTGSFIEPITSWDEAKLLAFNVIQQPVPMKELSFWDIDAPHLHDFFVSKKGQFKLTKLNNDKTLLSGTTWYYHTIRPTFYWQFWSNHIVHKIHDRVLTHIKKVAESEKKIAI